MPKRPEPDYKVGKTYDKGGPSKKWWTPNKVTGVEMGQITEQVPRKQRREMDPGNLRDYKKWTDQNKPK